MSEDNPFSLRVDIDNLWLTEATRIRLRLRNELEKFIRLELLEDHVELVESDGRERAMSEDDLSLTVDKKNVSWSSAALIRDGLRNELETYIRLTLHDNPNINLVEIDRSGLKSED